MEAAHTITAPPVVSVLLPIRDAGRYVDRCRQSLDAQTRRDFEVVAVDDGSRDETPAYLDAWARRDPRVRVFHRPALGLIAALNFGLGQCRGRLVARMDADDAMSRHRFALQVDAFAQTPRPDVVSCRVRHFPRLHVARGLRVYEQWLNRLIDHEDILRERFVESPIPHPSAMVQRSLLQAHHGYRDGAQGMAFPEDYDLWLRLAHAGARFAKVPRVLYFWRDHPRRLTRTDHRYRARPFLACKAHHLLRGPLRHRPSIYLWGAGQMGKRLARYLLDGGARIVGCLDIDPRKIGKTRYGIPVHDANDLGALWPADQPAVVLAAVPVRGARALIRARLQALGMVEGNDFWCVA